MIFATHKESFLRALDRVSPVVKSNPRSIDVLQGVKLETIGTDVFVTASSPMANTRVLVEGAVVAGSGEVAVNFDKLRDRVSKSGESMRLEVKEKFLRITSSDDQRLGIPINDLREFPAVEWAQPEESYGLETPHFVGLLKTASSVTSEVTSLNPAFLQIQIRDQFLWGANSVSYQRIPINCNPSLNSSIPTATIHAMTKFIQDSGGDKVWLSQVGKEHVVVSVGKDQFQAVPLALDFPNLSQAFDHTKVRVSESLKIDRKKLVTALAKAKTSADSYGRVTLVLQGTALTTLLIKTRSDHGDWYEEEIAPVIWEGKEGRTLTFNIDTLLSFLRSFKEEDVILELGDDFKGDLTPVLCVEGDHVAILNQFRV